MYNKTYRIIIVTIILITLAGCTILTEQTPPPTNTPVPSNTPTSNPTFTQTPSPTFTPTASNKPEPSPTPTIEKPGRMHPEELPEVEFGDTGFSHTDINRPEISGTPITIDTEHFRIHYTLEGTDRVPEQDDNNNGIPDYVEQTARVMEYIWDTSINHYGWNPPPPDEGKGGDDRYDVYLIDVISRELAFGYAHGGHGYTLVGDNPLTDTVEYAAHNSYFVLDNDYARFAEDYYQYNPDFLEYLYGTAGHEFMHALQFGYNGEEEMTWIWEATADWYEDEIFDDYNGAVEVLDSVFKSPDTCQLAFGGDERIEDLYHWYGMWIFMRYISEQYSHETVRAVWENLIDFDGYAAFEITFVDLETTLDEVFVNFAIALLARDFEEPREYPVLRLEGSAKPGSLFIPTDGVGQMAMDYIEIDAEEMVTIYFEEENMQAYAVGLKDNLLHVFPVINGSTSIDAGYYIHSYVIVINLNKAETEDDCSFSDYALDIITGGVQLEASWTVSAKNFKTPAVEGLNELPWP